MVAIAVRKKTYSLELIQESWEFVVNVPTEDLERTVYYCGYHSGREVDKFKETGLTAESARKVKPPIISECIAHMECKVMKEIEAGDKWLIIREVIEAYADETIVKGERKVEFAQGKFPRKVYGTRFGKSGGS